MNLSDYLEKTSEELEKMTTPQLLALRNMCFASFRKCGCYYGDCPVTGDDLVYNNKLGELQKKVYAILPTREHVPNKADRKLARQARAKRSR